MSSVHHICIWVSILKCTDVKGDFAVFSNYVKENHMVEYPNMSVI